MGKRSGDFFDAAEIFSCKRRLADLGVLEASQQKSSREHQGLRELSLLSFGPEWAAVGAARWWVRVNYFTTYFLPFMM